MQDITSMLMTEIEKFPIISFDVFDTLITRNVFTPRDIFFYIAIQAARKHGITLYPQRFMPIRQAAELSARKDSGLDDISIDAIYERLGQMLQLSKAELQKIKEEEIAAELKFTVPREEMFNIYQYALSKGKKVYFVSDMYLPTNVIAQLLTKCGYTVDNNLLVSGDYAATKGNGALFEVLKEKVRNETSQAQRILHIGDNFHADVKSARENGLNAIYIENVHKLVAKHPPIKDSFHPYLENISFDLGVSLMTSLITHKFYDAVTPKAYLNPESLFNGSAYNLGYSALGPLLLATCDWLISSAKQDKVDRLLFLARDGFIIKQAWDIVTENRTDVPKSNYILASRRAFNIPLLASDKSWNFVFSSNFHSTLRVFIEHRLGLEITKEIEHKLKDFNLNEKVQLNAEGLIVINRIIETIRTEILANASEEKRLLLDYLADFKNEKLGLVDLGHTGTIPYCYRELTQSDVVAYNILSVKSSQDIYQIPYGLNVRGYLLDSLPFIVEKYNLHSHVPLLETLFSSDQQQFVKFREENGQVTPIFMEEDSSMLDAKKRMVTDVQQGALDFVREYCAARDTDYDIFKLNSVVSSMILNKHFKNPADIDRFIWDEVYFENNFSGWKDKAIFSSSGKYISLWNEALNYKSQSNEQQVQAVVNNEQFSTPLERLVYVLAGEKKANKWKKSPKQFLADSPNILLKAASKLAKR